MSLSSTTARNDYVGAGSVGPYEYTFRVFAAADLEVTKRSATNVETTLAYPADFTVAGVGNRAGGTITLAVALAAGEQLTIRRAPPITQPTDFRNLGAFFPETMEDQLDRLAMIDQAQQDQLNRSLHLKSSYSPANYELSLPAPEAGKVLTGTGAGFTMSALDSSAVALPGNARTVPTLSAYLANNAIFNPLDYGALGNGGDDRAALQACLAAATAAGAGANWGIRTVDLRGRTYTLSDQVNIPGGSGLQIVNGRLVAGAAFPAGSYLLACGNAADVTLADGFKINNLTLRDLYFDNQHRGGGFLCQRHNRVYVIHCTFVGYQTCGLKTAVDGHEVFILSGCEFGEYVWGDTTGTGYDHANLFVGTGIELNTPDNHIDDIVIQLSKVGIKVNSSANLVSRVHAWTGYVRTAGTSGAGSTLDYVTTGIYQTAAALFNSYSQLYIDGCEFVIEDPWAVTITDSLFLHGAGDPNRSFIVLKPMAAGRFVKGVRITGNTFRVIGGGTIKGLRVDTSLGSISNGNVADCDFSRNQFLLVTPFYSRYRGRLDQAAAQDWVFALDSYFPIGVVQTVQVSAYQYAAGQALIRVSNINGNTVTVSSYSNAAPGTKSNTTATVYLEADINQPM